MKVYTQARQFIHGFGLVEILVGTAIIITLIVSLIGVTRFVSRLAERSLAETKASFLLEEGIEAMRAVRDNGWIQNLAPLSTGTDYYLDYTGSGWQLTTNELFIDGFERTIRFDTVFRDVNDDIAGSGTLDPNTRLVTVSVSWFERTATTTRSLGMYITNIFND